MSPLVAALLGGLLGVLVGAAAVAFVIGSRTPPKPDTPPYISEDGPRIIEALRGGAILVGPHDEVLAANEAAGRMAIVRETRIAVGDLLELVRQVRRDGEAETVNLDLKRGRGRPSIQLAVRIVPLSSERVFIAAEDREQQLRAAESSRDFMTNATHELKTPVGAIALLAEAIEDSPEDPGVVARFAGKIRAESRRLGDLVSQIITLSRLQGGGGLGEQTLATEHIVTQAVDRCRQLAEGRDVDLRVTSQGEHWVLGDIDQLVTAVSNLITNAISYSHRGARVVVSTRPAPGPEGDCVDIAVSDNGLGIAPEEQQRIFERFYRVDYARSRETGGTGLGLSIVQEVAERHDGTVTVWSKLGSGSTFTLRLPEAAAPEMEGES